MSQIPSSNDRPPLSLKILHPCTRSWDSLEGDRRRRYCDDCDLHVWNASELTEQQARELLSGPGRVCMGGMAKADGLLLTKERLREEARVHLRRRPLLRIAAALGLISIPTALAACAQRYSSPANGSATNAECWPKLDPPPLELLGDVAPTMQPPGVMSAPLPAAKP